MGSSGLVVTWSANPSIPGDLGSGSGSGTSVSVSRAQFQIDTLRIIGDAGPGDPRTTANNLVALWQHDIDPSPTSFKEAPIGLYSKVSLAIDGHLVNDSVEIDGTIQIPSGGTTHPFAIRDRNILPIALDMDKTLAPGETIRLELSVDLTKGFGALDANDWSNAKNDNGTLTLATVSGDFNVLATLAKFEAGMLGGFSLRAESSHATPEN